MLPEPLLATQAEPASTAMPLGELPTRTGDRLDHRHGVRVELGQRRAGPLQGDPDEPLTHRHQHRPAPSPERPAHADPTRAQRIAGQRGVGWLGDPDRALAHGQAAVAQPGEPHDRPAAGVGVDTQQRALVGQHPGRLRTWGIQHPDRTGPGGDELRVAHQVEGSRPLGDRHRAEPGRGPPSRRLPRAGAPCHGRGQEQADHDQTLNAPPRHAHGCRLQPSAPTGTPLDRRRFLPAVPLPNRQVRGLEPAGTWRRPGEPAPA
jgi:hypothetical protein